MKESVIQNGYHKYGHYLLQEIVSVKPKNVIVQVCIVIEHWCL